MKVVFISDLHLVPDNSDRNEKFFDLMNKWYSEIDELYILGDFFDYWLCDNDKQPVFDKIKCALKNFTLKVPTYFIVGNHDFVIGKIFELDTGVKLLEDCSVINLKDIDVLLSHGDVFCSLDIDYQRLKKILRNKVVLFFLKLLPLKCKYLIKNFLQKKSKLNYQKNLIKSRLDKFNIVDKTVVDVCKKYKINTVIHGHTHNPGDYLIEDDIKIRRLEIPDWVHRKAGGYIIFDGSDFRICFD